MSNVMTKDRFLAQSKRVGECLIFTGKSRIGPYGYVGYEKKRWLAHRLAYFFEHGELPDDVVVRHRCDTPLCIEPNHLLIGTHADNVADKVARRRHLFHDRHPMAKLNERQVIEIRRRLSAGGVLQRELAVEYGVSRSQIGRIATGRHWVKGA